jgi:hypothetical protein
MKLARYNPGSRGSSISSPPNSSCSKRVMDAKSVCAPIRSTVSFLSDSTGTLRFKQVNVILCRPAYVLPGIVKQSELVSFIWDAMDAAQIILLEAHPQR